MTKLFDTYSTDLFDAMTAHEGHVLRIISDATGLWRTIECVPCKVHLLTAYPEGEAEAYTDEDRADGTSYDRGVLNTEQMDAERTAAGQLDNQGETE